MSLLKSSPKIDAQISLYAADGNKYREVSDVFYGDDKIAGVATFNLKKNYDNVHYRLLVKGVVSTKVNDYPAGSLNNTAKVEDFSFLSASLFDGPAKASSTPNTTFQTRLPFKFSLQRFNEQLKETYGPGSLASSLQQLVPTLDSKDTIKKFTDNFKSTPNFEYRINYHITASAYVDDKLVGRGLKGFVYTPTSSPQPPIAIEDFPDEYVLRSTELPRRSRQISRVGVVSEEPAAITLAPNLQGDSTNIKLLFMLIGEGRVRLPTQCHIKATLRTTTFVMPTRAHPAMHTVQAMSRCKEGVVKVEKSHAQEFTMSLRKQWQSPESDSDGDDKCSVGEEVHTATLSFPFRIEGNSLPPPTFYSPLLSRRYAVDLSLDFDDDTTPPMKLRLPLQVVYESQP